MSQSEAPAPPGSDAGTGLHDLPRLIERMHRRFLDVVRQELGRAGIRDISPVQAMMLGNIGDEAIAVRDLIERGYYLGSNASYNLKNLIEGGYVERQTAARDRRSAHLRVTDKGRDVLARLAHLESDWAATLARDDGDTDIAAAARILRRLERCWSDAAHYTGLTAGDEDL